MMKSILLLALSICTSPVIFAQTTKETEMEATISSGFGIASAAKNNKSIGKDFWFQLEGRIKGNISGAVEFENMRYKQKGYIRLPTGSPNKIKVISNSFSLLLKYYLTTEYKMKFAIGSGFSYNFQKETYFETIGSASVTTYNNYRIPLLAEAHYPVLKI